MKDKPLTDDILKFARGKWEASIDFDIYSWSLGIFTQIAHEYYPFAFCIDVGPFLLGVWYHPNRGEWGN